MPALTTQQKADLDAYLDEELADLHLSVEKDAALRRRIFRVAEEWTVGRLPDPWRPTHPYMASTTSSSSPSSNWPETNRSSVDESHSRSLLAGLASWPA